MIPGRLTKASASSPACKRIASARSTRQNSCVPESSRRHYASSTKQMMAAAAAAQVVRPAPPPPFSVQQQEPPSRMSLSPILPTRVPLTMLPTPLPEGETNPINNFWYPSSKIQQALSLMDALLRDGYDIPRAARMFERLRVDDGARGALDIELYNSFLGAYLSQAIDKANKADWLKKLWGLFRDIIAPGVAREMIDVSPNKETFAIALLAMVKFSATSPSPVLEVNAFDTSDWLNCLKRFKIPIGDVIGSPLMQFDFEACLKAIRLAALDTGRPEIVSDLAKLAPEQTVDILDEVPEVRPVIALKDQYKPRAEEGDGTDVSTPYNLATMRDYLKQVKLGRETLGSDAAARQRIIEESAYQIASEKWAHDSARFKEMGIAGRELGRNMLKEWMWEWFNQLKERLSNEIPTLMEEEGLRTARRYASTGADLYSHHYITPWLRLLSEDKLAIITITEIMRLQASQSSGMKTARTILTLGRAVEIECDAELSRIRSKVLKLENIVTGTSEGGLAELAERRALARSKVDQTDYRSDWTQEGRARVGSFLADALIDVAKVTRTGQKKSTGQTITEEHPAFIHSYEFLQGKKLGIIKLNPVLSEQLAREPVRDALHPRQLPMLVPPRPWIGPDKGGYMYSKIPVMRYKESTEQAAFMRAASEKDNLEILYASLDVLGSTPWAINKAVFDIMLTVWNSGEAFAKIPPVVLDIPDPVKPDNYEVDPKAKVAFLEELKRVTAERTNNHTIRCDVNYKMEIARSFLGEKFYLPHNIDFRGRAYPIPPNLNHLGDDLCRGLLTFANKRALGERGLRWLKIHLANKFGYDKASFEERVNFTMEHLDDIYDSAENPLKGARWWLNADDPWQCLASCIELRNALESPDPLAFESSLPVHQDGTCNGLQHYAALGGDNQGARQVNLDVTDRPSDVYTFVADMVEARLEEEMQNGVQLAMDLRGKVARKVVKQTVMTTVYGVTFVGARDQIRRQLDAIVDTGHKDNYDHANYLTRLVLGSIADLFQGAKSIQLWLNNLAWLVARSIPPDRFEHVMKSQQKKSGDATDADKDGEGLRALLKEQMTSVIWTTPLGLPIVQPYRKVKRKQLNMRLQSVFISDPNKPSGVNPGKQASAFPPNFIHSLDATHMMLTALEMRDHKLTFASVHDSYWTHAASIDEMSKIIRSTFVTLHSQDILQNLYEEFKQRYQGYKVPATSFTSGSINSARIESILSISAKDLRKLESHGTMNVGLEVEEMSEDVDADEAHEEPGDVDAELPPKKKRGPRRKCALHTRFINLVDLLPPPPKRGDFNIERTRDSLYFFS